MFGRTRQERRADTERQFEYERQSENARAQERRESLGLAKSDYIAGRIQFEELWPIWWRHDVRRRPAIPMQNSIEGLLREAMELERSRIMRTLAPLPHLTNTKDS